MNPFNVNMLGMANLSAMSILPEAQLLAAHTLSPVLKLDSTSLTSGLVQSRCMPAQRPGSIGGHSIGEGANYKPQGTAIQGGLGRFRPGVLGHIAGWLRTLGMHKYTNFEGKSWKEMVVVEKQGTPLEAQGVPALGVHRKMQVCMIQLYIYTIRVFKITLIKTFIV